VTPTAAEHLAALARHGREAVAFAGGKAGMRLWRDAATGACVAYADTGRAWVAAGSPLGPEDVAEEVARRFVAAAADAGRRAVLFGPERPLLSALPVGEQPLFVPAAWPQTLARNRRLREQLRRARAKGLVVRAVEADELAPGTALRARVERLAADWVGAHHVEPMGFVVALEPFLHAHLHRYFVATLAGEVVAFLSAVPMPARRGWLVEDVFRDRRAPNGTTESLLDALLRAVPDAEVVTLGLAALTGPIGPWLRLARFCMRPLYDFDGLRAFKSRLHPGAWQTVWLSRPRGMWRITAILLALGAFAKGSLVRFGLRSIVRHPSGPPFVMALPLAPWTLLLAVLALIGRAGDVGFSTAALWAWVAFDAALAVVLYRAARRPRPERLGLALGLAATDAALSLVHLGAVGFGAGAWQAGVRGVATLAPLLGTAALVWSWRSARRAAAAS